MKNFAVAYMNFFDSDLKLKTAWAAGWKEALKGAFPDEHENVRNIDSIEEAKEEAFNQDWLFDVIEIPTEPSNDRR